MEATSPSTYRLEGSQHFLLRWEVHLFLHTRMEKNLSLKPSHKTPRFSKCTSPISQGSATVFSVSASTLGTLRCLLNWHRCDMTVFRSLDGRTVHCGRTVRMFPHSAIILYFLPVRLMVMLDNDMDGQSVECGQFMLPLIRFSRNAHGEHSNEHM